MPQNSKKKSFPFRLSNPLDLFVLFLTIAFFYQLFIKGTLKYIPIPGYRTPGEALTGGWVWDKYGSCEKHKPVLVFSEHDVRISINNKIVWKLLEIDQLKQNGNVLTISGTYNRPKNKKYRISRQKGHRFHFEFYDYGKKLDYKKFLIDGEEAFAPSHSLAQCNYPDPYTQFMYFVGLKAYWKNPE